MKCLPAIKIRPNLSQNGAISLLSCFDDKSEKIEKLALAASEIFDVQMEKNLTLLTIRHYTEEKIKELTNGKDNSAGTKNNRNHPGTDALINDVIAFFIYQ